MNIWNIKALFYRYVRSLPVVHHILQHEIENLGRLWGRMDTPFSVIVDVGTGTGACLGIYPDDIPVIGIDRSIRMLTRNERAMLFPVVGEAYTLPLYENSVPFISAVGIAEYLQEKRKWLVEMKRILSPDGYLLLTIAPPNVLNSLRRLLGNRIYLIRQTKWEALVENLGFFMVGREQSLLQIQYLFRMV